MEARRSAKILESLFLILLFFATIVAADQLFTSGAPFGRSNREPRYDVKFHSIDSPFYPENGQESIPMTNHEGKSFMCFLPVEEKKSIKSVIPQNASNVIIESERKTKPKQPDELLDILKDQCFYRHEGWWSYEFCYQGKVRQIHIDGEKVVQEFVLGIFDPEATALYNQNRSFDSLLRDPRSRDVSQRYHSHQYTNGTKCDLTDVPRETEVRFVCSQPTVLISSIKEISSCKYVLTLQSPMLCKNPMFQQEKPTLSIHCNELPSEAEGSGNDDEAKEAEETVQDDETKETAEDSETKETDGNNPVPEVTQISMVSEEPESFAT